MRTALMPALFVLLAFADSGQAQEKADALTKSIELGVLEEYFKVVSTERTFDPSRGGTIVLKLEVKKDVDTSQLFCKVGFFDKDKHMHLAGPLRFDAAFPLQKGESINVTCWEGRMPQEWHRIAIRRVEKPVLRSEYHNQ